MYTTTQTYKHYYPFGLKHGSYYSTATIKLAKKEVNELVPQNLLDGNIKIKPTTDRAYKYKYNGKEWQDELGLAWYDYGARNYEPSLGRWMNLDPLSEEFAKWSPYTAMNDNPINYNDPTGLAAEWIPDSEGNLIAESGDNAQTLAKYQGITYNQALKQMKAQGYTTTRKGKYDVLNLKVGDKVELDNVYTRNLSSDANLPNGSSQLKYNCWGSSCAGSNGKDIKVGVGIDIPVTFDNILKNDYKSVNSVDAKFGETILRFTTNKPYANEGFDTAEKTGLLSRDPNSVGGSLHGAVFYGKSKNETIYIYTKNGWNEAPRIMKLKDLENNSYYNYGTVRGLNSKSGFYNKK